MRKDEHFSRWLTGVLLVALLLGGLGGAGLSARAAPRQHPLALCPDPRIAQWTFSNVTAPSTGNGTFSAGSGIDGPTYPTDTSSDSPSISYTRWDTPTLDSDDFLELDIDTTSWSDIIVSFKYRSTGSGPTTLELHYSIDGTSFTLFDTPRTLTTDSNFHQLTFDLSSILALNNNANTKFKIFAYGASAWNGNLRIDNLTITGYCPPLPLSVLISEVAWAGTAANGYYFGWEYPRRRVFSVRTR
jgi:hypothetical protein